MIASTPEVLSSYIRKQKNKHKDSPDKLEIIAQVETKANRIKSLKKGKMGQKAGSDIQTLLDEIANLLKNMGEVLPKTTVKWDTRAWGGDIDGKSMLAEPLSLKPGKEAGSQPYQESALWKEVKKRRGLYVRGHLLNHHVHGPGIKENLTPITNRLNGEMERNVEDKVKHMVLNFKYVVSYKVDVEYGGHQNRNNLPAEQDLPTKLSFELYRMKTKPGTSGENADDWIKDNKVYSNSLPHELPQDSSLNEDINPRPNKKKK
jgi:hypothetical protein